MQNPAEITRWAILAALITLLFLLLPTWKPKQVQLDTLGGGYRAVLNDQSLAKLEYGTELVTTAEPLGYSRNRDYWPGRYAAKLAWDLLITLVFAVTCWSALRRSRPAAFLWFAVGLLVVIAVVRFDIFRRTLPTFCSGKKIPIHQSKEQGPNSILSGIRRWVLQKRWMFLSDNYSCATQRQLTPARCGFAS